MSTISPGVAQHTGEDFEERIDFKIRGYNLGFRSTTGDVLSGVEVGALTG